MEWLKNEKPTAVPITLPKSHPGKAVSFSMISLK